MAESWVVWLWRRNVVLTVVACVALAGVAAVVNGAIPTPQLRGPSLLLGISTVHALVSGAALPLAVVAADPDLEAISPRPIGRYRLLTGAGLLTANALLLVGAGALSELDGPNMLAALRTMVIVAAVCSLMTRALSFAAAIALLLAYVGCVLFAGVDPDGSVAPWAGLLARWQAHTDPWLIAAAIGAMLYAFAAKAPRHKTAS